jgi:hypothetical protein
MDHDYEPTPTGSARARFLNEHKVATLELDAATTEEERQAAQKRLDAAKAALGRVSKVQHASMKDRGVTTIRKRKATDRERVLLEALRDAANVLEGIPLIEDQEGLEEAQEDASEAMERISEVLIRWHP